MGSRVAVVHESPPEAARRSQHVADADLFIAWHGDFANVTRDVGCIYSLAGAPLTAPARDLIDIATGLFIADIAIGRGRRELWPRDISIAVPVRDPDLWDELSPPLNRLIFELTRDNVRFHFYASPTFPARETPSRPAEPGPDCVSMLSGGLDSLAGAVMLQEAGRRPAYCLHASGNPSVQKAQQAALQAVEEHWPGKSAACSCTVEPNPRGSEALDFPPAEEREPSRRTRSLLFTALAFAMAEAIRTDEVFMCENGVLTAGLPLSPARAGSLSTHSTHPAALQLMNDIAESIGLQARVSNPFIYQTKGELLRDMLTPHLSSAEIQSTVSCWAVGRAQRQCGGCIPCLLRRLAMAYAGLPEEAYMIDLLASPEDYLGTDAYGNLMDMLRQIRDFLQHSDAELLASRPGLLSLHAAGVDVHEMIAMLRRHARQAIGVLRERFPHVAKLID